MQPSPQPVAFPEQVEYLSREDLVVGTNVKIATVARKISKLGNFMEAEVSLSPTIVVPFINDKGYYRVRTVRSRIWHQLDSGQSPEEHDSYS